MKKKIIITTLIVVVVGLIVGGYYVYQMYQAMGLQPVYVEEESENVPDMGSELPPITVGGSDWLNWRGPNYSGKSTFTGIRSNWDNGLQKLWEVGFLCQGKESLTWSQPVIQGNRLVIPGRSETHDLLFCLDAADGGLIWKSEIECLPGESWGTGSRATPAIRDSLVYSFGSSGILACWSLYDGELMWKKDVMDEGGLTPEWGHSSSPLIYENMVIVQGGGDARLIAFDKRDGKVLWKTPGGEAGYSAVVMAPLNTGTVLLQFHGTGLAAVDPSTGKELWSAPWETNYYVNCNTPIVRNDTVFITSGYNTGSQLLKISKTGYNIIWESDVIASHLSDQILLGNYLYGYTKNAGNRGPFACVMFKTGEEVWSTKEIGGGSIAWVDDHFVALGVKGDLFLVKPNPEQFTLVGKMENAIPEVPKSSWTPPVVANGKLYLRYMQKMVCYDLMP